MEVLIIVIEVPVPALPVTEANTVVTNQVNKPDWMDKDNVENLRNWDEGWGE